MNSGFVLFGAGKLGQKALLQLGKNRVAFFMDNNNSVKEVEGIPVYSFSEGIRKRGKNRIVISVSAKYENELRDQLRGVGIKDVLNFRELLSELTREKIENRTDYIGVYRKAINWIKTNTIENKGIICNSGLKKPYPEVSGYYIPTLINWGYRDLAIQYAEWLCSIQKEDGSWWDTNDKAPYVFDTGQVLKGLLAVRTLYPKVDQHIQKGCEWLVGNIEEDGHFHQADGRPWDDSSGWSSELIHLYCLLPLIEAADVYGKNHYKEKAEKAREYYTTNHRYEILNFNLLSHFYAYVMEALLDLGEIKLVKEAMDKIKAIQKDDGSIPGLKDVNWVCSTGLFQLALVWYRLGEIKSGDKAFNYACKLQNNSGGWYGSYSHQDYPLETPTYFSNIEISWAVKYFLDALTWKNKAQFELQAPMFQSSYKESDGRVQFVSKYIEELERKFNKPLQVCDVGCGKGAYICILKSVHPDNRYYGVDISERVMSYFEVSLAETRMGSLMNIPFSDGELDMVYACESLEHAIDIYSSIREMARVTVSGGYIVVIDKDKQALGRMEIEEWEQWFDTDEIRIIMQEFCSEVYIQKNIPYADNADGLFCGWVGVVK